MTVDTDIPAEEQGIHALPADASPEQRARAEATWRGMQDADTSCRCSRTRCYHGQPHEEDDSGQPCSGRLLHIDRFPGGILHLTLWHDQYVCDTCDEPSYAEGDLPDIPWGETYNDSSMPTGSFGTREWTGRHPNFH